MTDEELVSVLVDTEAGLGPTEGYGPTIEAVRALIAERDRLRAALEMIAIPPIHVPDLSEGCEGCAGVARAALDGTDYRGPISVTPAQAATGILGPTSPEYQALMQQAMDLADEGDRLRGAVEAAQSLVEALDSNPIGEYGDAVCEAIDALDGKLNAAKEGDERPEKALRAERDRLRAVVEVVRNWRAAQPGHESAVAIQTMNEAFAQLDGSGDMGGEGET